MNSSSDGSFLISFTLGAAVALCCAAGVMTLQMSESVVDWLNKWQTLVSGMLALVGALLAVIYIQRQIDQTNSLEEERRERHHFAARATLPAALADLKGYARAGLEALKAVPRPAQANALIEVPADWVAPTLPRVPSESIAVLRDCIESADTGPRREMAKLLADLQICNSRLYGLFMEDFPRVRRGAGVHNMHEYLADFLELSLRTDRMIAYARGREPEIVINIALGDMTTAAVFADLENYPGLNAMLVRRYPAPPA